jgi:hypothetical protein
VECFADGNSGPVILICVIVVGLLLECFSGSFASLNSMMYD